MTITDENTSSMIIQIPDDKFPMICERYSTEQLKTYVLRILEREKWSITENHVFAVLNQLEMELHYN